MDGQEAESLAVRWHAVENLVVGGWMVATVDKPYGTWAFEDKGWVVADLMAEPLARYVADLHNARLSPA